MRRPAILVVFTLATLLAAAYPVVGQSSDPLLGTWKLNLAKSKFTSPAFQSQTIKIERWEDGFKNTTDVVEATGQARHVELRWKPDGKEYPIVGSPRGAAQGAKTTRVYKRRDDYTNESVERTDGKVTLTRRTAVSRDGKTLTITVTGTDAQGQSVNSTQVYDRQ